MVMKPSTCFSSGTMRASISSCCLSSASCCSICFNFGRYDSSSLFSRILSSRACCAAVFFSFWLLNTVKYSAAETTAPPRITTPHCLMPDSSPKFAIGPPLRLSLLAGQGELKGLHFLDLLVLIGFLDLDVLEEASLLQIRDQVRHRVGRKRCAFEVHVGSLIVHLAQPHRLGVVDRLPHHRHQVDRPGLPILELLDDIHVPLIDIGLVLAVDKLGFHIRQFAILLLGDLHLGVDFFREMVQPIPVHQVRQADDHHHHQDLQLGRSHVSHFHRGHHRAAAATFALAFGCFQKVDFDHRDSKLLRAKPTATAICPGFFSTSSAPMPSAGGVTRWNGFSNSTGMENSCRNASTNPGTFEEPPAR